MQQDTATTPGSPIKQFRKKLKNIETDTPDTEQLRVQSATNGSSRPFQFHSDSARRRDIDNTILRLQKLEEEKAQLLHELDKLKEGAVNALVEKEEVIERLKEKVEEVVQSKEVMGEERQREYTDLMAELEQAITRVDQYKKEMEAIRQEHLAEVAKRDHLIIELGEELEQAKLHLLQLSHSQKTLSQKFNQAQSQKQQLQDELVRSKVNLSLLRQSLTNSQLAISQNEKDDQSLHSQQLPQYELSHNRLKTDESLESERVNRREWENIERQELDRLREENQLERERHAKQMEDLRNYYQQKLQEALKAKEKENQVKSIPKSQSVMSISRRNQDKLPMPDLRNELLTNLKTEGSCQQDNQSGQPNQPYQDNDKVQAMSQFSNKYFSYDRIPDSFQKDSKKRSIKVQHDVIHEMNPREQGDPSFTDWLRNIGLKGWLLGGLVVTGLLFVLKRRN